MLAALISLTTLAPVCPDPEAWLEGERSTKAERLETRARMRRTWRALGADDDAITVLDTIAIRESRGDACAVHVLGVNEFGMGPMGLSWRWHRKKFDGISKPTDLRIPEVSAVIAWRIWRSAVERHHVRNWGDGGEVYAGRFGQERDIWKRNRFCNRLSKRGVDCEAPVSELGDKLPSRASDKDRAFVVALGK